MSVPTVSGGDSGLGTTWPPSLTALARLLQTCPQTEGQLSQAHVTQETHLARVICRRRLLLVSFSFLIRCRILSSDLGVEGKESSFQGNFLPKSRRRREA